MRKHVACGVTGIWGGRGENGGHGGGPAHQIDRPTYEGAARGIPARPSQAGYISWKIIRAAGRASVTEAITGLDLVELQ